MQRSDHVKNSLYILRVLACVFFIAGMIFFILGGLGLLLQEQSGVIPYGTPVTFDVLSRAVEEIGALNLWKGVWPYFPWDSCIFCATGVSLFIIFSPGFLKRRARISLMILTVLALIPFGIFGALAAADVSAVCFCKNERVDGEHLGEGCLYFVGYFFFLLFSVAALIFELRKTLRNNKSES